MADKKLPGNKECADCINFTRCFDLFRCDPNNTECDFYPIRFSEWRKW